ncbi:helix-turn-helix transcriptional regulator [Hyphomicrobium sp. NDB2Meth4]|uniref:helix-turn-helix domain-containing protein n=1 Tax=Hyphomicrobium sp. NDB2Meth4 TaxID=1892846 RepID=UPI000930865C|nr:helix-turn-helix transcriptional regulator [Hyphomicrobium sp. NDB2Meth4]
MNKLKDLRTQLRLTQKQVAEQLNTTQQTIQRWESGHTEIPAGHLKDLAVLFGCSIDELLGVEAEKRRGDGFARARPEMPWGAFAVSFPFGTREYPIDVEVFDRLFNRLHPGNSLDRPNRWIQFSALDNRLVFLNPSFINSAVLVTDDEDSMPFFASPEAYKALSSHQPGDVGPLLREEYQMILRRHELFDKKGKPDLLAASAKFNSLEVVFGDGRVSPHYLSEDVTTNITIMEDGLEAFEENGFMMVCADAGHYEIVNLSKVAAIEVPVEAYLGHLADDAAADD